MIKKFWPFVFCLILTSIGCGAYYTPLKETPPTRSLKSYRTLSLGWLDLGEEKAQHYGYKEGKERDWILLINEINLITLPQYLDEALPGKTIFTVSAKSETPKNEGLLVVFSDVNYLASTNAAGQIIGTENEGDSLAVTIRFIDAQSGEELAMSKVRISSRPSVQLARNGYLNRRVNYAAYNLAYYIAEKIDAF